MRWLFLFLPLPLLASPSWFTPPSAFEEPWGKDAGIAYVAEPKPQQEPGLVARAGIAAIRFHQVVISPVDGPRSHFAPSSSQYTLQAMKKYGFVWGFIMGCSRLERENAHPWVYRTVTLGENTLKEDIPFK